MKGSAITGPVGKEAAELWPVSCFPPPTMSLSTLSVRAHANMVICSVLPPTPVSSCKRVSTGKLGCIRTKYQRAFLLKMKKNLILFPHPISLSLSLSWFRCQITKAPPTFATAAYTYLLGYHYRMK